MFPAEEMPRSKMWFGALATQCPVPRPGDTSRHVLPPGPSLCSPAPSGQTSLEEAPVSRTERQGTSFFCSFWFPSSSYSWMGLQCVRPCACVCTRVCVVHFCFIISMLVMTDFFSGKAFRHSPFHPAWPSSSPLSQPSRPAASQNFPKRM